MTAYTEVSVIVLAFNDSVFPLFLNAPSTLNLGVIRYGKTDWDNNITDLNEVAAGIYRISSSLLNCPSDFTSGNALLIVFGDVNMGVQLLFGNPTIKVWFRSRRKSSDNWLEWTSLS